MSVPTGSLPTFRGNSNLNYEPGVITYFNTRYRVKITDENGTVTYLSNSAEDAQKLKRIMRILAQADYHTAKRDLKNTTISDSKIYMGGNKVNLPSEREVKIQKTFNKIFPANQKAASNTWVEFKPDTDDEEVSDKEEPATVEPDHGDSQLIPNTNTKVHYISDPKEAYQNTITNKKTFDFSNLNLKSDEEIQKRLDLLEQTVQQYLLESIHTKVNSVTIPPILTSDALPPNLVAAIHHHAMNRINKAIEEVARNNKETQLNIAVLISSAEMNKAKKTTAQAGNTKAAAQPEAERKSKKAAAADNPGHTFPGSQTTFKMELVTKGKDYPLYDINLEAYNLSDVDERTSQADILAKMQKLQRAVIGLLVYALDNSIENIVIPSIRTGDVGGKIVQAVHALSHKVITDVCGQFALNNPNVKLNITYIHTEEELRKFRNPSPKAPQAHAKASAKAAASPQVIAKQNILGTDVIYRKKESTPTPAAPTEFRVINAHFDLGVCKTKQELANREKELGANVFNELLAAIKAKKSVVIFPPLLLPAVSAALSEEEIKSSLKSMQNEVMRMIGVVLKDHPHTLTEIIFEA